MCTVKDCLSKALAKGMCSRHYYRVKRGGTTGVPKKYLHAHDKCSIAGCDDIQAAKGLCFTHYAASRRRNDPEFRARRVKAVARYKKAHPEKDAANQAKYRNKHRPELTQYYNAWLDANREDQNAYRAARKARVKEATPPWADIIAIERFYKKCPHGYHVDHIIPLRGKNVSGLHVLGNLQYLPAIENLRKGNRFAA